MFRYFIVKQDDPAHTLMSVYFQQEDIWESHRSAIEALIETNPDHNLAFNTTQLGLKHVPDALKKQFRVKPQNGVYYAKENAAIKKKWVMLAETLRLPCITDWKLHLYLGLHVIPGRPKVKEYVQLADRCYVVGHDHPGWKDVLWGEELTERHFWELYQLHKGEKAHVSMA